MQVQKVQSPNFTGIKIIAKQNKDIPFLYNKLLDITRKEKVGGIFATDYVQINSESPKIVDILNSLKIKFKLDSK